MKSSRRIRVIDLDEGLEQIFPVIAQLRTAIDYTTFREHVSIQRTEGYRLVMMEDDDKIVAAAGFRMLHGLSLGRFIYTERRLDFRFYKGAYSRSIYCSQLSFPDCHRVPSSSMRRSASD